MPDESGLSQRPHRVRTWAPRGQTPVLQYCWYPGAIKMEQVLDFFKGLLRHLPEPLLLVWDRLPGHPSRLVQDYIDSLGG